MFNQVFADDASGQLTLNIGNLMISEGNETINLDCRIPVTLDGTAIISQFEAIFAAAELDYHCHEYKASLYMERNTPLIKAILENYRAVSGDLTAEPLATGGGTYARAFPNCVAFGAIFPGQSELFHQPNEALEIKYLAPALEIYAKTLYDITTQ